MSPNTYARKIGFLPDDAEEADGCKEPHWIIGIEGSDCGRKAKIVCNPRPNRHVPWLGLAGRCSFAAASHQPLDIGWPTSVVGRGQMFKRSAREQQKKAPRNTGCLVDCKVALLRAQDRILGGLGHTEFHDPLGLDLDCFAGRWIASLARLAIHQHQFAQARQGEAVLRVLVSQLHNGLDDLRRLPLGEVVLGGDFSSDLGFSQSFGHNRLLVFLWWSAGSN